jgi:2-methylaconitate cis-trans-isomerase PrpF
LPGSVTAGIATVPGGDDKTMVIEHPIGSFTVRIVVAENDDGEIRIEKAGVIRTARMLFSGEAFVRSS